MISILNRLAPDYYESWGLIDKIRWVITLRWLGLVGMLAAAILPMLIGYARFSIWPLVPLLVALAYNAFFASHASSLASAGELSDRQTDTLNKLAHLHLALDSLVLIVFLYLTGGLESPFPFFLIFVALAAGLLFDRRMAALHVNWAWLLFAVMALLVYGGWLPYIPYVQQYLSGFHQEALAVMAGLLVSLVGLNGTAFLMAGVAQRLDQTTALVAEAEAINEINRATSTSLDLETTLSSVLAAIKKFTNYFAAEINLWDEEQQVLVTHSSDGDVDPTTVTGGIYGLEEGYSGWLARHRQPLLISDTRSRDDIQAKVAEQRSRTKSYCGVPLVTRGRFIGTLEVACSEVNALTERHRRVLSTIASQVAIAVENAYLYRNLDRQLQNLVNVLESVSAAAQHLLESADDLSASSESMSAAGEEVSATVQEIADGAQMQAEQVEKISKSIQQLSATIHHIADGAKTTAQASAQAAEAAQAGGRAVEEAQQTMSRIQETIGQAAQVIHGLSERSRQIGEIVDTINHFADQTNLLSLNAAIEAARAGEYGRSFGVVADEVRRLAESSANSAQQVTKLIEEIQSEITAAVHLMETGTEEVWQGVEVIERTSQSLDRIHEAVGETTDLAHDISATTHQQEEVGEGIVRSVNEVAVVAEQNAAATEEVSAAVEEQTAAMEEVSISAQTLTDLAAQLRELVSQAEQAGDGEPDTLS